MNRDLSDKDPLIIFRCKNKQCLHIFTPSAIMIIKKQKIYFECPICGSKYKAQYTEVEGYPKHHVIMLLERPQLIYLGTKIASS